MPRQSKSDPNHLRALEQLPAKPAQAATIKVPRMGGAWKLPPDDPEAKARAVAFLERMGIKRREGG